MAFLSIFDPLYCQEGNLELEEEVMDPMPLVSEQQVDEHYLFSAAAAGEEEWADVLRSLVTGERETRPGFFPDGAGGYEDTYIGSARKEALEWVARAAACHSFSALTVLLAANYLDRCFLLPASAGGLRLQGDKPWMGRLAAVACLSLAAKVEETHIPLLVDLQVAPPAETGEDENEYLFEPKTVRRMELLVLSALGWRMNPVTPLSFIHHLLPRIWSRDNCSGDSAAGGAARIRVLVKRCEAALLSVIADWKWVEFPAPDWAAAALLHASESNGDYEIHSLIALLKVPKEKMEKCYDLITESMASGGVIGQKRKNLSSSSSYYNNQHYSSRPPSPNGVIGSCFSCESSCDSWAVPSASVSSSPDTRPFKRPCFFTNGAIKDEGNQW